MGHTTTTTFTVNGQKASVEDDLGHTTSYGYGHGGELLTTTDPLSHTTTDHYDSRYRLTQTTDANAGVTSITLDGVGNRTKLVDSVGNETDWTPTTTFERLTKSRRRLRLNWCADAWRLALCEFAHLALRRARQARACVAICVCSRKTAPRCERLVRKTFFTEFLSAFARRWRSYR
jgi:YD repeat-containing protein